jgi:hypothetical protein
VTVSGGLLDELLEHEARYWRRTAVAVGLPRDGRVLNAAGAAAILLGAAGTAPMADAVG